MKEKIIALHKTNPSLNYAEIAQEIGCDPSTVRYHLNGKYRETHLNWRLKRRKDKKLLLVQENGGKCCQCGYSKCMRALEFHHTNPQEKDFEFHNFKDYSMDKLRVEMKKCIVVCSNCHKEIHEALDAAKS